jgi:hypothetical protein
MENDYLVLEENLNYWENKKKYSNLMQKFIDEKIDGTKFVKKFFRIWNEDRDKSYRSKEVLDKIPDGDVTK